MNDFYIFLVDCFCYCYITGLLIPLTFCIELISAHQLYLEIVYIFTFFISLLLTHSIQYVNLCFVINAFTIIAFVVITDVLYLILCFLSIAIFLVFFLTLTLVLFGVLLSWQDILIILLLFFLLSVVNLFI